MSWNVFTNFLSDIDPLINLLVLIFWGIYVFYTIKTFREVQRQTDLQNEAFLVVSAEINQSIKDGCKNQPNSDRDNLFKKWYEIIKKNIPTALQQDKYITLKLNNRGRSDIIWWKVNCKITVVPSDYLNNDLNINGDICSWYIEQNSSKEIIPQGESIEIVLTKTGVYPEINIKWDIEYKDMRNKVYKTFGGDNETTDKNVLCDKITDKNQVVWYSKIEK